MTPKYVHVQNTYKPKKNSQSGDDCSLWEHCKNEFALGCVDTAFSLFVFSCFFELFEDNTYSLLAADYYHV